MSSEPRHNKLLEPSWADAISGDAESDPRNERMAAEDRVRDSATALTRFGLGARPGERTAIAGDPRGFVLAQISKKASTALPDQLPASPALFLEANQYMSAVRSGK